MNSHFIHTIIAFYQALGYGKSVGAAFSLRCIAEHEKWGASDNPACARVIFCSGWGQRSPLMQSLWGNDLHVKNMADLFVR